MNQSALKSGARRIVRGRNRSEAKRLMQSGLMQNVRNKTIRFTKASACGNDFLIVPATEDGANLADISRALCDRHNGIGADGVEWVFPDAEADARVRLFNADGSEAEISGNGTRCVAAEMCSRVAKQEVVIRTEAGLKTCKLMKREGTTV